MAIKQILKNQGKDNWITYIKNKTMKYKDLTHKIIGCAMEVHSHLGNGFQEVIYQRALAYEMKLQGLSFAREFEMQVWYKNLQVGTRRVDFLVEEYISTEIKAVKQMDDGNLAQGMNYLECYNLEIGLLINFGARSLQFKRLHNNKYDPDRINPKYPMDM